MNNSTIKANNGTKSTVTLQCVAFQRTSRYWGKYHVEVLLEIERPLHRYDTGRRKKSSRQKFFARKFILLLNYFAI